MINDLSLECTTTYDIFLIVYRPCSRSIKFSSELNVRLNGFESNLEDFTKYLSLTC